MKFKTTLLLVLSLCLMMTWPVRGEEPEDDSEVIMDHIHKIFRAFIEEDWETVRKTHTDDWTGFKMWSSQIVTGINSYMAGVYNRKGKMLDYEITDSDVQVFGEIAIVYYLATMKVQSAAGEQAVIPIRSLEVYRKEKGGWIQSGSHLGPVFPPESIPQLYEMIDVMEHDK